MTVAGRRLTLARTCQGWLMIIWEYERGQTIGNSLPGMKREEAKMRSIKPHGSCELERKAASRSDALTAGRSNLHRRGKEPLMVRVENTAVVPILELVAPARGRDCHDTAEAQSRNRPEEAVPSRDG